MKSLSEIRESYDRQAGTYIAAMDNPGYAEMKQKSGQKLAGILDDLRPQTLLDAGTGEATTLVATLSAMKQLPKRTIGFDISLPRLLLARDYLNKNRLDACLLMASLSHIPFGDSTIDVVTTYHAIEPNREREREIVLELLRVTGKYLVMVEPSYELADESGKARMDRLGYVRNLPGILEREGIQFTLMPWLMDVRPENPAAVIVVEKRK